MYGNCPRHRGCLCPYSCVIVVQGRGSRTIVHTNKDLPELTLEEFVAAVDLDTYDWIHFEGRNKDEVFNLPLSSVTSYAFHGQIDRL